MNEKVITGLDDFAQPKREKRVRATPKMVHARIKQRRRERDVLAEIERRLKQLGYSYTKNHGTVYSQRGRPDLDVMVPFSLLPFAVRFCIELKRDANAQPSQLQRKRMKDLNDAGAVAFVASNWETIEQAIESTRLHILEWFQIKEED